MEKLKTPLILVALALISINTYAAVQTYQIEGSQLVTPETLLQKGYETFYSGGTVYEINLKKKLSLKVFHNSELVNIRSFSGTVNGQDSTITLDSQGRILFDITDTSIGEKKSIAINGNGNSITISDNIEAQVKASSDFIDHNAIALGRVQKNPISFSRVQQRNDSNKTQVRVISIDVYVANDITDSTDDIFSKSYASLISELEGVQKTWKIKPRNLFVIEVNFYTGNSSPITSHSYKSHSAEDLFQWFSSVEKKGIADFYQFLSKSTLPAKNGTHVIGIAAIKGFYSWSIYDQNSPSHMLGYNLNATPDKAEINYENAWWCQTRMQGIGGVSDLRYYCDYFSPDNINRITNEILRRFTSN